MKKQVTRVMLFSKQTHFYTLSSSTDYKWISQPLLTEEGTDYSVCPTEWPKNVQISSTEWLFFGGGDPAQSGLNEQPGTKLVTLLDTRSQRLTLLTEMPDQMCAH